MRFIHVQGPGFAVGIWFEPTSDDPLQLTLDVDGQSTSAPLSIDAAESLHEVIGDVIRQVKEVAAIRKQREREATPMPHLHQRGKDEPDDWDPPGLRGMPSDPPSGPLPPGLQ